LLSKTESTHSRFLPWNFVHYSVCIILRKELVLVQEMHCELLSKTESTHSRFLPWNFVQYSVKKDRLCAENAMFSIIPHNISPLPIHLRSNPSACIFFCTCL